VQSHFVSDVFYALFVPAMFAFFQLVTIVCNRTVEALLVRCPS